MEPSDVERYLELEGRNLRLQLCKEAEDDDVYQQTSLDILRDCARYTCPTPLDFTKLFCRYFLTIRSRWRWNHADASTRYKHYSLEEYRDSMGDYQLNHYANDPREDLRIHVKEYIELLPHAYQEVFMLIFIEGLTLEEVATHTTWSVSRVNQFVQAGSDWIRDELQSIEKM